MLDWGIAAAAVGIVGNQLVARYKLVVGRRIRSATMVADAKHSWLDALSSAGAMLGLIGVALGWGWADAIAGIVVTGFICHVGWEVTARHRSPPTRRRRSRNHHDRRDRRHQRRPVSRMRTPGPAGPDGPYASRWKASSTPTLPLAAADQIGRERGFGTGAANS